MELDAGGCRGAVQGTGCTGMAGGAPPPGMAQHGPVRHGTVQQGTAHESSGIPGSEPGSGLVPRTRRVADSPGSGAGITGWRWMEQPIAPDAVSAPGQLLSPEGWTD